MPDRTCVAAIVLAAATATLFAPVLQHAPVSLAPAASDTSPGASWTNLALHALAAALVLVLCARATGRLLPSGVAAALFAWHPLRVESVALLTARGDLQATTAVLVALLAYDGWSRRGGAWRYALAVAAYATASAVATPWLVAPVPLLLLLLDIWPLGRLDGAAPLRDPRCRHRLVEKLPFVVVAIAPPLLAPAAVEASGNGTLGLRIASAFADVARYVGTTVLPIALTPLRPVAPPPWWTPGAVLAIAATTVTLVSARTRVPGATVGWLWVLASLLPVVGKTPPDRSTYLPAIGVALGLAWGLSVVARDRKLVATAALVAAAACVGATARQITHWRDEEALVRHALTATDDNGPAELALARILVARGAWDEAATHAAEAVRLRPADDEAQTLLGEVRLRGGHLDAAAEHFARAVAVRPDNVPARFGMGRIAQRRGHLETATAVYRDVLERAPDDAATHEALARVLRQRGDLAGAREHFERALALGAPPTAVLGALAQTLAESGDLDGAVERYQTLLALTPGDAAAHDRFGTVLVRRGDLVAAEAEYRAARDLRPDLADAALHLGALLAARGALDEALAEFDAALRLAPALPSAQYNRALVLEERGDLAAARSALRAELAVQADWPPALLRLAALLATDPADVADARALADRAAAILGPEDPEVVATRRLLESSPAADSP